MDKTKKVYQEEDGGTFEADGVLYDLNYIFRAVAEQPILEIDVDKLKWVLQYDAGDPERLKKADMDAPILVWKYGNQELAVDGLHRLRKAVNAKRKTLFYRRVNDKIMKEAIVKSCNEQISADKPVYLHW